MKKTLFIICACVLGLFSLNSCSHSELDGKWKVESIEGVELGELFNEATLEINTSKGEFYAVTGVNYLNGKISVVGEKVKFTDGPMTRMAADPHSMEVETAYVHALSMVKSYSLEDGKLLLKDSVGQVVMTLVN